MRILSLANAFYKTATYADQLLDPESAAQIVVAFEKVIAKPYDSLVDARNEIYDAIRTAEMDVDIPSMEGARGGFKLDIGYPDQPSIRVVSNARVGIAWRQIGNQFQVVAHLLDENGNRIKEITPPRESKRPPYMPGEGDRYLQPPPDYFEKE